MRIPVLVALLLLARAAAGAADYHLYDRTNLVAWCIVPFDAAKRGPEERAAMLQRLGFTQFAYDYRAEHIPQWDAELDALANRHIALKAWWFPSVLNDEGRKALDLFKRHNVHPQLWVAGGGEAPKTAEEQKLRVESEAKRIGEIAKAAQARGCSVALYNHGGWFGEPENQVAIIRELKAGGITNVGIVYNLHHGHDHLDRFPALLALMKPHLVAININGMVRDGEKRGLKILPVGKGELDAGILKTITASGWRGPIGILNHTQEDAENRLRENLEGLERLVAN